MKNKNLINEVFWLRCIACIAVTFGHALQNGNIHFVEPSSYHLVSYLLYMTILFGVPAFVFISEFLLSNKYSMKVPPGFLIKRVKILVVPYVFMSIIYSFFEIDNWNIQSVLIEASKNIFFGESTVYFVLIIFQFYFLHIFLSKYLNRISPIKAIPIAFVINIAYLSVFNFVEPPNNTFTKYFWDPGYWMPFVGWIFYFVLGYYCGKNYYEVLNILRKYNKWVILMPVISIGMMFVINKYLLLSQNSKRVDMLIFATSMILLILYVSSHIKNTPRIVMLISNYSFSIFLLNEFFFLVFLPVTPPAYLNILTYSVMVFLLSMVCSIILSNLLNKLPYGKYLVGQIMRFKTVKTPTIKQSA